MKQVNIKDTGVRAPHGFWRDLANKLADLPPGKGLSVTTEDFPANGFTGFRQSLYNPLRDKNKALRSKQASRHEVILWTVDRES